MSTGALIKIDCPCFATKNKLKTNRLPGEILSTIIFFLYPLFGISKGAEYKSRGVWLVLKKTETIHGSLDMN